MVYSGYSSNQKDPTSSNKVDHSKTDITFPLNDENKPKLLKLLESMPETND